MNQQYLYHYTNIEALALILKNKTIRFSPLNKMDDLQETESSDIHNVGQVIYVSSWTNDAEESIPMWNMYASLSSGIRIKLPVMPFKLHENRAEDLARVLSAPVQDNTNGKPLLSLIPIAEMVEKKFICVEALNKNILYEVEYTSEQEKLLPHIKTVDNDRLSIETGLIGKAKNLKWAFQHEWRYRITILPLEFGKDIDLMNQKLTIMANKLAEGFDVQPLPFYDMAIDNSAFSQIEITASPKMSVGNKTILDALVEKYDPAATIKESELTGML